MIHLIFILTILSGIIQEINSIVNHQTVKKVSLMYAFGCIFFLFYQTPLIVWSLICALNIFSIIDFIIGFTKHKSQIQKINNWICLVILLLLGFYYIINFI